jgi:hypothetical protein
LSIPIYLAFSPEEHTTAKKTGHPLACMGYQLSRETPALLAPDPLPASDTLLVLQDNIQPKYTPTRPLALLVAQYAHAFHTGLVCDFDRSPSPFWEDLVALLDGCCQELQLPFCVSEPYAAQAPNARVLIGSDISGGNFQTYVSDAAARYPGRCVLELRPISARFSLPCPSGVGVPLPARERDALHQSCGAPVWESDDLLCSYFSIWVSPKLDVVLFDTPASIRSKIAQAEHAGFQSAIGLYQELNRAFPDAAPFPI